MEGVVVVLQHRDAGWKVSVTSNADGEFQFPAQRLPAGDYHLSVRAVGFELAASVSTAVTVGATPTLENISLMPVKNRDVLASQLTSLEWLTSWPVSKALKDAFTHNLVNCMFCHTLGRITRSTYSADEFMPVIQRMLTYETDHSSAQRIQRVSPPPAARKLELVWYACAKNCRSVGESESIG